MVGRFYHSYSLLKHSKPKYELEKVQRTKKILIFDVQSVISESEKSTLTFLDLGIVQTNEIRKGPSIDDVTHYTK